MSSLGICLLKGRSISVFLWPTASVSSVPNSPLISRVDVGDLALCPFPSNKKAFLLAPISADRCPQSQVGQGPSGPPAASPAPSPAQTSERSQKASSSLFVHKPAASFHIYLRPHERRHAGTSPGMFIIQSFIKTDRVLALRTLSC